MKERAPRNRTITLSEEEKKIYQKELLTKDNLTNQKLLNKVVLGDMEEVIYYIPNKSVDLLFLDPPYNLNKKFNSNEFKKMSLREYEEWVESWFSLLIPKLKPTGQVYFCGDWSNSSAIYHILAKYLIVINRITWEREKGRGATKNWKNSSEDIWFATVSKDYYFDVEAVKLKRKVIAPYRENGKPKDWQEEKDGNFRLTHPSNLWTDISIPFWSMPENTDHPTQKPEKLLAKLILASTKPNDVVFDPFLGSGTTAVVAKKLNRNFYAIEKDLEYSLLALKRLKMAELDRTIQGYHDGVFWERNSLKYN